MTAANKHLTHVNCLHHEGGHTLRHDQTWIVDYRDDRAEAGRRKSSRPIWVRCARCPATGKTTGGIIDTHQRAELIALGAVDLTTEADGAAEFADEAVTSVELAGALQMLPHLYDRAQADRSEAAGRIGGAA